MTVRICSILLSLGKMDEEVAVGHCLWPEMPVIEGEAGRGDEVETETVKPVALGSVVST